MHIFAFSYRVLLPVIYCALLIRLSEGSDSMFAALSGLDLELGAMAAAAEAAEARAAAAEAAVCERDAALAQARADLAQLRADKQAVQCEPPADGKALFYLLTAALTLFPAV